MPAIGVDNSSYKVALRVYDISDGACRILSPIFLGKRLEGVWHTGVLVHGYEYFYGGGIVKMRPEAVEQTFGIKPARIHSVGTTTIGRVEFERYLLTIMPMFRKESYDLCNWNCNHFSDHICQYLADKHVPSYILDLPAEVCKTFVGKIIFNFIKMMQGGQAPIQVDDPKHPKHILERESMMLKERRNSIGACCDDTAFDSYSGIPSRRSVKWDSVKKNELFDPSLSRSKPTAKSAKQQTSNSRSRVDAFNLEDISKSAVAVPRSKSVHFVDHHHSSRDKESTMFTSQYSGDSQSSAHLQHSLSRCSSGVSSRDDEKVMMIQCEPLGDTFQSTTIAFSPKHRRLYETERKNLYQLSQMQQQQRPSLDRSLTLQPSVSSNDLLASVVEPETMNATTNKTKSMRSVVAVARRPIRAKTYSGSGIATIASLTAAGVSVTPVI